MSAEHLPKLGSPQETTKSLHHSKSDTVSLSTRDKEPFTVEQNYNLAPEEKDVDIHKDQPINHIVGLVVF